MIHGTPVDSLHTVYQFIIRDMIKDKDECPDGRDAQDRVCGRGSELPRPLRMYHTPHTSTCSLSQKLSAAAAAKLLQSCPTLCDPIDGSPPGSPVPRILQARTLEWVAISFSSASK